MAKIHEMVCTWQAVSDDLQTARKKAAAENCLIALLSDGTVLVLSNGNHLLVVRDSAGHVHLQEQEVHELVYA